MASLCLSRVLAGGRLSARLRVSAGALAAVSSSAIVSPLTRREYVSGAGVVAVQSGGKHWKMERVAAVGLLGLVPAAFLLPGNAVVDYGLAILMPLHGHWGLEAVIADYVPASLKTACRGVLYLVTVGTMAGLLYLNYADVGICKAVSMIWAL